MQLEAPKCKYQVFVIPHKALDVFLKRKENTNYIVDKC